MSKDARWKYQNWLMDIVIDRGHQGYESLLDTLFNTEFYWSVKMDENRAADGIHLRTVFNDQTGYSISDYDPCSVLEMMIALAVRGSEDILWDGENNYTPYLFWTMIDNLGLSDCKNRGYNEQYVLENLRIFMDRSGEISLFGLSHFPKFAKSLEIWYQMQEWISQEFL